MKNYEIVTADVLVIGAGGAGSRAAISASDAGAEVVLVAKGTYGGCGSTAVAFAETTMITGAPLDEESNQSLYNDTFTAGMGLLDPALLRVLVQDCADRVQDLISYGLKVKRRVYDDLFSSGFAHSTPRTFILDSRLQWDILDVLMQQVRRRPIRVVEQMQIVRLLVEDGRVVGALGFGRDHSPVLFRAGSVILAGGGAHGLFLHHPSTGEMIGDSYAMAYHAGARMVNMELLQIGPTGVGPIKRMLSGPVWRLKPVLTNAGGEEFLDKYLPEGVEADEIFRLAEFPYTVRTPVKYLNWAVYGEIMQGRGNQDRSVWLDVTRYSPDAIRAQAPFTYEVFKKAGLDMATDRLPFSIGVQTFHGGCLIRPDATTDLDGLYACGEAAGGLMAAERPGGNALAECQVFGHIAGQQAASACGRAAFVDEAGLQALARQELAQAQGCGSFASIAGALRTEMFESCLTIREESRLTEALSAIESLQIGPADDDAGPQDRLTSQNALTAGRLIAQSALLRRESRGCHCRRDYPAQNEAYDRPVVIQKKNGNMTFGLEKLW